MGTLTVLVFCAAVIVTSGLQSSPENKDRCSKCKFMFDELKFSMRALCPDVEKAYEVLKADCKVYPGICTEDARLREIAKYLCKSIDEKGRYDSAVACDKDHMGVCKN